MKKLLLGLSITVYAVFSLFLSVRAASAPNIISYQGRILNASSVPVADATASMIFKLYDDPSAGVCIWSNSSSTCASATARTVTLTGGLFTENLGDTTLVSPYAAITDSVFADNSSLYLEVVINGETLSPRKQIVSAPFALNSDSLDGLDSTTTGATASAIPAFNSSGALVITGTPGGAGVSNGSLYVNPGAASANDTIFGIGDNGADRFRVDKEGDIYIGGVYLQGGTGTSHATSGATVVGVFPEFSYSTSDDVQSVLKDFDTAIGTITGGASFWTDATTYTYLTATAEDLVLGGNSPATASLFADVSAGQLYLGTDGSLNGALTFYSAAVTDPTLSTDVSGNLNLAAVQYIFKDGASNTLVSVVDDGVTGHVTSTGGYLAAAASGLDTSAAGVLTIGNTTATTVSVCNSAACDTLLLANNADADTITIGDTLDTFSLASTGLNVTSGGALTGVASIDTISTSATAITFAGAGTVSSGAAATLTVDSGTTGTLNLGTADSAKIINLGTGTAGDTINIGTNNTVADAINIGSALDTVTITGNSSSTLVLNAVSLSAAELALLDGHDAALVDTNDAVATAIIGTGALNAGSITGGFGTIDTGADNITTTGTVFANDFDRSTAGVLTFGNTNATTVSVCNSATCDTLLLGNNADADTITLGDSLDTTSINGTGWSVTSAGLITTADDLALNGGDLTSTSATFNMLDAAANSATIEIGGVTTDLGNTVRIATNATTADAITIGNTTATTTMALNSGAWNMASTGILSMTATAAQTTAIDVTDTDYTNALSIGDNNITGSTYSLIGTTSTINFTNFDVASTGAITVAAGVGLDTNGAGTLALGNTNATTTSICNSAACDTLLLGNNADADTITIGDSLDSVSINGTIAGNLDMGNNLILNIGNAGTDFGSGGSLTLAGALEGAAGNLLIGSTTALVQLCNSATCDDLYLGTNTDADNIVIGDALSSDSVQINSLGWAITADGVLTMSASAPQTTAIVATDTSYTNAISLGDNAIIGTTANIDLNNFDVTGSSGDITTAGDLALNGGDLTSIPGSSVFNLLDAAANAPTIEIGGVTTDLANTVRLATNGTTADTITIGNTTSGTTTSLIGGAASVITFTDFGVASTGATTITPDSDVTALTLTGTNVTTGPIFSATANSITAGTGESLSVTGLTSGVGLSITGGTGMLVSGRLAELSLGAATTGAGINVITTGIYSGGGLMTVVANSATAGIGEAISMTGLTTGSGIAISGGSSMAAAGELIDLSMGSATDGSGLNITDTGLYAGGGLIKITANSANTGIGQVISMTSLTSGTGLSIVGGGASMVAGGELIDLAMGAAAVGNGINVVSSGIYSGTGLITLTADSATSGTIQSISMTGQTTGTGLSITGGGANLLAAGELINLVMGAATVGNGENVVNTGVYIGTGLITLTANSATAGVGEAISMLGLTTGTGLSVTGGTSMAAGGELGDFNMGNATAGNGINILDASGVYTGTGLLTLTANAATSGVGEAIAMTGQTTGTGLSITGGGANLLASGELVDLVMGAATVGTGINMVNTGVYTGGGFVKITGNSATSGTGEAISMTGLTTGTALSITGGGANMAAGGVLTDLNMGAATAGTGLNMVTTGVYTGGGVIDVAANSATSGNILKISATGLTSGHAIDINGLGNTQYGLNTDGIIAIGLASANSKALCANTGAGPASGTAYDVTDCNALPAADYAEMYPVAVDITYGDVVATGTIAINTYGHFEDGSINYADVIGTVTSLVKTNSPYQANVIGIVSNNYEDFSSAGNNIRSTDNPMPVALNGRVPVKIATSSDSIVAGDYLTTSSEAGRAMKATSAGTVIGKALESWMPGNGQDAIMVYVEQGYSAGSSSRFAEQFETSDNSLGASDLVCVDSSLSNSVKRCSSADTGVTGVLTSDRLVGLAGQINAHVSADDGAIAVGDPLTVSSTLDGYAGRANTAANIVGYALQPMAAGRGTIKILVQPHFYAGSLLTSTGGAVMNGATLSALANATASSPAADSSALALVGSAWNGVAAIDTGMNLSTSVTNSTNYQLSIKNQAGNQVAAVTNNGDLMIAGRLFPSDRGMAQSSAYIYYDSSAGPGYMKTNAAGWSVGSYDFAEMFPSADLLQAGDVVIFGMGPQSVVKSTGTLYDVQIAGVVSTRPGFLAGDYVNGSYPIALAGRVPTHVSAENGAVNIGDPLTTSSKAGYAMKATEAGMIMGYAMESLDAGEGTIVAFVRAGYYAGSGVNQAPAVDNSVSKLSANLTDLNVTGSLNMSGGNILAVNSISGLGGLWKIADNGDFITQGHLIEQVKSYQGDLVDTYAAASTQVQLQLTGTVTLQSGQAVVKFADIDPKFQTIISSTAPYRVVVTPSGITGQLYVTDRTTAGFTIRDGANSSGVMVDWLAVAYEKDHEPSISSANSQDLAPPADAISVIDTSTPDVIAPLTPTVDVISTPLTTPDVLAPATVLPDNIVAPDMTASDPTLAPTSPISSDSVPTDLPLTSSVEEGTVLPAANVDLIVSDASLVAPTLPADSTTTMTTDSTSM